MMATRLPDQTKPWYTIEQCCSPENVKNCMKNLNLIIKALNDNSIDHHLGIDSKSFDDHKFDDHLNITDISKRDELDITDTRGIDDHLDLTDISKRDMLIHGESNLSIPENKQNKHNPIKNANRVNFKPSALTPTVNKIMEKHFDRNAQKHIPNNEHVKTEVTLSKNQETQDLSLKVEDEPRDNEMDQSDLQSITENISVLPVQQRTNLKLDTTDLQYTPSKQLNEYKNELFEECQRTIGGLNDTFKRDFDTFKTLLENQCGTHIDTVDKKMNDICTGLSLKTSRLEDQLNQLNTADLPAILNKLEALKSDLNQNIDSFKSGLDTQYNNISINVNNTCERLKTRTEVLDDQLSQYESQYETVFQNLESYKQEIDNFLQRTRNEANKSKEIASNAIDLQFEDINRLQSDQLKLTKSLSAISESQKKNEKTLKATEEIHQEIIKKLTYKQKTQDTLLMKLNNSVEKLQRDTPLKVKNEYSEKQKSDSIEAIDLKLSDQSNSIKSIESKLSDQTKQIQNLCADPSDLIKNIRLDIKGSIDSVTETISNVQKRQTDQETRISDIDMRLNQKANDDDVKSLITMNTHNLASIKRDVKETMNDDIAILTQNLADKWQTDLCQFVEKMTIRNNDQTLVTTLNKMTETLQNIFDVTHLVVSGNEHLVSIVRDAVSDPANLLKLLTNISVDGEKQTHLLSEIFKKLDTLFIEIDREEIEKTMKEILETIKGCQGHTSKGGDLEKQMRELKAELIHDFKVDNKQMTMLNTRTKLFFNTVPKNESLLEGHIEYQLEPSMEQCRENDLSDFYRFWNTAWSPESPIFLKDTFSKLCSLAPRVIQNCYEFISYMHTLNSNGIFDKRILLSKCFSRRMHIFKTGPRFVYPYFRYVHPITDTQGIKRDDIGNGVIYFRLCVRNESTGDIISENEDRIDEPEHSLWVSDQFHYMISGGELVFPQCAIYPDLKSFFYPYENPQYYGYVEGMTDRYYDMTFFFFEIHSPCLAFEGYNMPRVNIIRDIRRNDWFSNITNVRDKLYDVLNDNELFWSADPGLYTGYAKSLRDSQIAKERHQMAQGTLRKHVGTLLNTLSIWICNFNTSTAMKLDTSEQEKRIFSTVNTLISCIALIKDGQSNVVLKNEIRKTLDSIGSETLKSEIIKKTNLF